jgi:hypothetical protein
MLQKLKEILQFGEVAGGATVSLPHGLNDGDKALVPDYLEEDTAGVFDITADDTNVTVTNLGAGDAEIDVLCEHWHSTPRQLGGDDNLTPQPWTGQSKGPSLLGSCSRIVYSRDNPNGNHKNVFDNFQDAYDAAVNLTPFGNVIFEFDSQHSTHLDFKGDPACDIPAGTWDFTGIYWSNYEANVFSRSRVDILEGAVIPAGITGLSHIIGRALEIEYDGEVGSPIELAGGLDFMGEFCIVMNSNPLAAPMIQIQGFGGIFPTGEGTYTWFGGEDPSTKSAAPLIDINGAGFSFNGLGAGSISNDAYIDSAGGGFAFFSVQGAGVQGRRDIAGGASVATWDIGLAPGSFAVESGVNVVHAPTTDVVTDAESPYDQVWLSEVTRVDTTNNPVTVNLLPITGINGYETNIKDVGGNANLNNITVAAAAGETIDGAATATISTANGSLRLISDNAGNWMVC